MTCIYKITNLQNGSLYIGQTHISPEERWKGHCTTAFSAKDGDENSPLHKAIRKYGESNFKIEVVEQCPDDISQEELDSKEIYWISYYNSYKNGYNASIGGKGHTKYNYDEIVNYYLAHNFSIRETCTNFNIYDQVVYNALKSKNIDYKNLAPKIKKPHSKKKILMVEENKIFNSLKEINDYFGKEVGPNIRRCLKGMTKKAYGYHWKELEDDEI